MNNLKELRDKMAEGIWPRQEAFHNDDRQILFKAGFDEALKAISEMEFDEWHFKGLFREANPDDWHKFSHYENFYVAGAEEQLIKIKERLK